MTRTGQTRLRDYAAHHWPVWCGAMIVIAATAFVFRNAVNLPLAMLFPGIAALALPHMTVTGFWREPTAHRPPGDRRRM